MTAFTPCARPAASRSASTFAPSLLDLAAWCSGVNPSLSRASKSAPASKNRRIVTGVAVSTNLAVFQPAILSISSRAGCLSFTVCLLWFSLPSTGGLTRIRHQLPAADADARALRGRAPSCRFDVLSSTPASPSGPRGRAGRRLDALATKVGDGCGLADNQSPAATDDAMALHQAASEFPSTDGEQKTRDTMAAPSNGQTNQDALRNQLVAKYILS